MVAQPLERFSELQVETARTIPGKAIIQTEVELFQFIQRDTQPAAIGVFQVMKTEVGRGQTHIAHIAKTHDAKTPEKGNPVFGLQHGHIPVAITALVIAAHAAGAAKRGEASQGNITRSKKAQRLQREHLLFVDPDKLTQIDVIIRELEIGTDKGSKMIKVELHHDAMIGRKSIVAGIIRKARPKPGYKIAHPACDIFFVKDPARGILHIKDPLKLIDKTQKKIAADPMLRMQVYVILLKFIKCIVAVRRIRSQSPKMVGK